MGDRDKKGDPQEAQWEDQPLDYLEKARADECF